jgi:hypothetical protein
MDKEEKKDLKPAAEDNGTGNGQPDKKPTNPEGEGGDKKPQEPEMVQISKAELEKIKAEKENFRMGVIRLNARGRFLPGSEPLKAEPKKPKSDIDFEEGEGEEEEDKKPKGDFLTKKDLQLRDEKSAIKRACAEDPELDEHWNEIIGNFPSDWSRDSVEDIMSGLAQAKLVWKAMNPDKPVDQGKKDTADLAADKGLGKGKEKEPTKDPDKRTFIPKKEGMESWYK